MINRILIKKNINTFAIIVFLILFATLQYFKPSFLYDRDGSLRQFGLGYRRKTVIPIWLISIILAVLSYLGVLYYLTAPRIHY